MVGEGRLVSRAGWRPFLFVHNNNAYVARAGYIMSMVKRILAVLCLLCTASCVAVTRYPIGPQAALGAPNCAAQSCIPFGYGPGWQAYQLRHPTPVPVYVVPR